jgi:hypothetical protein
MGDSIISKVALHSGAHQRDRIRPTPNRLEKHNSIQIYICNLFNDTFLQFSDTNEGKKKQVRLKAYCVFTEKLEGNYITF